MKTPVTKASSILALAVAGSMLLWAGCGSKKKEAPAAAPATEAAAPPPLPADVAQVAKDLAAATPGTAAANAASEGSSAPESLTATGELISPVRSEIVSRLPGRVGQVLVEEGDAVRRGQPILRLEAQYLAPELDRAKADLGRSHAALAEAEADFHRKEELLSRGSIPQSSFDRSKGAYDQASAAVAAADAAVALARQRLDDTVMSSPMDGVVAERKIDVGERLGDNTVAFVLAQVAPLRLRFSLPERLLPLVQMGQTVEAQFDPFPGETFTGRIVLTGKVVDSATRTFALEAELPNRDHRLKPGLFARVTLTPAAGTSTGAPGKSAPGAGGQE